MNNKYQIWQRHLASQKLMLLFNKMKLIELYTNQSSPTLNFVNDAAISPTFFVVTLRQEMMMSNQQLFKENNKNIMDEKSSQE